MPEPERKPSDLTKRQAIVGLIGLFLVFLLFVHLFGVFRDDIFVPLFGSFLGILASALLTVALYTLLLLLAKGDNSIRDAYHEVSVALKEGVWRDPRT